MTDTTTIIEAEHVAATRECGSRRRARWSTSILTSWRSALVPAPRDIRVFALVGAVANAFATALRM